MDKNTAFRNGLVLFIIACIVTVIFGLVGLPLGILFFIPSFIFFLLAFKKRSEFSFEKKVWLWFLFVMSIFIILLFVFGLILEITYPPKQHYSGISCEGIGGVCLESCSNEYPIHNFYGDKTCNGNICCVQPGL